MNPITHGLIGWALGATPSSTHRERVLVTAAALAPDLDGLGLVAELATRASDNPVYWWSSYHHILCHNLAFAIVLSGAAAILARRRRRTAVLVFVAVHSHIVGDLIGARGPDDFQWPIPYLYPFSETPALVWEGQWYLNAWPNIVLSIGLLAWAFFVAWRSGYSPVGLLSKRADSAFVETLRARFGPEPSSSNGRLE